MMTPSRLLLLVLSVLTPPAGATAPAASGATPDYEPARAATIAEPSTDTLDTVVRELYARISGPKGQRRDRQALEVLLHPDVRFLFAERTAPGGTALRTMGREAFLAYTTPLWESGFFESEVARQVVHYGRVAHVWSTYETRRTEDGPVVGRGINSIQLFFDGKRWQVVTVYWQSERRELPIPAAYLSTRRDE